MALARTLFKEGSCIVSGCIFFKEANKVTTAAKAKIKPMAKTTRPAYKWLISSVEMTDVNWA